MPRRTRRRTQSFLVQTNGGERSNNAKVSRNCKGSAPRTEGADPQKRGRRRTKEGRKSLTHPPSKEGEEKGEEEGEKEEALSLSLLHACMHACMHVVKKNDAL